MQRVTNAEYLKPKNNTVQFSFYLVIQSAAVAARGIPRIEQVFTLTRASANITRATAQISLSNAVRKYHPSQDGYNSLSLTRASANITL